MISDSPAAPTAPSVLLMVTGLGVGGAERIVLELADAMRRCGLRVIVLALKAEDDLLRIMDAGHLDIRFLGLDKSPASFLSAVRSVARIVRDERIDVIHAHLIHALMLACCVKLIARQPRLVFTSHNFGGFTGVHSLFIRATRALRDCDVLLAPDQHPAFNAARTELIPNGVRLQTTEDGLAPRRAVDGPALLAIGRLTEAKHPEAMIDAFHRWVRAGAPPSATLRIAGEGPLHDALERRIDALGLRGRVALLGVRRDIPTLLASADAFVMSSRWEGLPLVALEAAAAGVPVIAPPVGGLRWLLADDCGWLASPAELPAVFARLAHDPAPFRRRAERFRRKVAESFSHERCFAAHLDLYRQLAAQAMPRPGADTAAASTLR